MFLKIKDAIKESHYSTKSKYICRYTLSQNLFLGYSSHMWIKTSHNIVQLNPDKVKYYLPTPYPTLIQQLKKTSPESIRAIAHNPNFDLKSIGIYSKSDIQHHIRTQQIQE